jgi:hypothetical protein
MAGPFGQYIHFRYSTHLLPDSMRGTWAKNGYVNYNVIVFHALIQEYLYHKCAYLPIRIGKVIETSSIGETNSIVFELADYCALSVTPTQDGAGMGAAVRAFSDQLRDDLGGEHGSHPDAGRYVGLGTAPASDHLEYTTDARPGSKSDHEAEVLWERSVSYLRHTLSLRDAAFWRIQSIGKRGSPGKETLVQPSGGEFSLASGQTYTLHLVQFQARETTEANASQVSLSAPEDVLEIVGASTATIQTEYDAVPFQLFAVPRDSPINIALSVDTQAPTFGATLQIPLRITTDKATTFATSSATVLGLFLTATPALLSADTPVTTKLAIGYFGALVSTVAIFWRRLRGLVAS